MRKIALFSISTILFALIGTAAASQLTTASKSFEAGKFNSLKVEVHASDIEITPGWESIDVQVVGIDQRDVGALRMYEDAGTVMVEFKPEGRSRGNVRFKIGVPEVFDLDLATSGGDILINGKMSGSINCATSGGDISMQDVAGEVSVRTSGGDIQAGAVEGNVEMKTSGGDIEVASSGGKTSIKTAGGDIKIGDIGDELEAVTAGGDIELGNVNGSASVKTAGGDIKVGQVGGSASLKTAGGDVELASASGAVEATTAGGDLNLRGVADSIQAKTSGGDIHAEITAAGSAPSNLQTAGGDIVVDVFSLQDVRIEALVKVSGNWGRQNEDLGIYVNGALAPSLERDATAKQLRATVGNGSYVVKVTTVNGNIEVNELR